MDVGVGVVQHIMLYLPVVDVSGQNVNAADLNPQPPDTNKAEADLNDFEEFAKKCVAA